MPDWGQVLVDVCVLQTRDALDGFVRPSRRHSDDEVVRYVGERQRLGHEAALAGGEPVLHVRRPTADLLDVLKHLDRLQVARVEPAKPAFILQIDHHRLDPLRVIERVEAALLGRKHGIGER